MAHIAETFMDAVFTTLTAAMPTVTVTRDDTYLDEIGTLDKVDITQGDDIILNSNIKYTDSELTFNIDLFAAQSEAAAPIGTKLNALRAAVVQALQPSLNGANSLGVAGASQLLEGDTFAPATDNAERPTADLRMVWTVQIRRDVDDPETFTP